MNVDAAGLDERHLARIGEHLRWRYIQPGEIAGSRVVPARRPPDGVRWIRRQEGVDSVVVDGEVTWSATGGHDQTARAGQIATWS